VNKKIAFFLIMAMLLSIVLVACGSSETTNTDSGGTNTDQGSNNESGDTSKGGSDGEGETIVLKASFMSTPEHAQYGVLENFGKELEQATNGRVKIEMYPGGALAPAAESYDAVVTGIADIAWVVQGYTPGRFPLTGAIALPFIEGDTAVKMSKTIQQYYEQFSPVQEEYKDVKVLWMHASDPYHIYSRGKQVKTVEDLKGLKIRSNSTEATQLIEALGGTPISMPLTDFYDAVQKGVVDGAIAPLASIKDFNLGDVLDYVTIGNFFNTAFTVVMNKAKWESLDPEIQKIIDSLIGEKMAIKAGEAFERSLEETYKIIEENNIEVYEMPQEELDKLSEASQGVIEQWIKDRESEGLPGREAYETLQKIARENNQAQ